MLAKYLSKLIVCLLFFHNCFSQENADSGLNNLVKRIIENIITTNKQKALLVTDRKIYAAGETVYFKALLVDSIHNYLQANPNKLYVDWVDKKDYVLNQLILNNAKLQTNGHFVLPDSLNEGFYWIRAYTKQMLNSNINNVAVQPFYVVGKNKTLKDTDAKTSLEDDTGKPIFQFYPEGGSVMSGLNSTIALSAKNKNGKPVIVSGIVKDNHDSVIATFATNKYGLAKFSYFPVWYDKYAVFVKSDNNYDSIAGLPRINFYAAQLSVAQQNSDYIKARVALEDSIYSRNYTTYLIAVSRDSLCFASVGKGMYNVIIPIAKFPAGVATLYLFNDERKLLSSRTIYVRKEAYHLIVHADKEDYSSRDKVKLNFKVTNATNQPEIAAFSLSVVDKNVSDTTLNFLQNDDTLKYLPQPDADLIMLAQKQKSNPLVLTAGNLMSRNEDTDFVISGKIVNLQNEPVAKCVIVLLSDLILKTDTSDVNGKFKFYLPAYTDGKRFTFQLSDIKGKSLNNCHAIFDADSVMHFSTPPYLKTTFSLSDSFQSKKYQLINSDSVYAFSGKNWLNPVTVKGYKKKKANYDEKKRVGHYSHIITRDMIGEGAGMTGFALLRVPGIRLMNGFIIAVAPNEIAGVSAKDEPMVILDGVEVNVNTQGFSNISEGSPVLSFLNSLPVSTIDFIEVLTGAESAAYGIQGGRGVILINTKSGGDNDLPVTTALKNFYAKGFYNDKPFKMPDYSDKQIQKSKFPDLRKTIYWNGNIITNKDGEASVEFFSADPATTYIGTITGVTVNGDKIYQTFTLNRH